MKKKNQLSQRANRRIEFQFALIAMQFYSLFRRSWKLSSRFITVEKKKYLLTSHELLAIQFTNLHSKRKFSLPKRSSKFDKKRSKNVRKKTQIKKTPNGGNAARVKKRGRDVTKKETRKKKIQKNK